MTAFLLVAGFSLLVVVAFFVGREVGRSRADSECRDDAWLTLSNLYTHAESVMPAPGHPHPCWELADRFARKIGVRPRRTNESLVAFDSRSRQELRWRRRG